MAEVQVKLQTGPNCIFVHVVRSWHSTHHQYYIHTMQHVVISNTAARCLHTACSLHVASQDQFTCNARTGVHACRGVSYNYGLAMLHIIPCQHGTHHPYTHVERPTYCRSSLYKAQHYSATVPLRRSTMMASVLSLIISCTLFFSCKGQGKSVYGGSRSCSCFTRVYSQLQLHTAVVRNPFTARVYIYVPVQFALYY